MPERPYILQESGKAFPADTLVAALDEFSAEDRYSSRRDQILREIRDRPFAATVLFLASDRTYGYTTDDRFRDGQTLSATLEGSDHRLSLQMPAALNKQLSASQDRAPIRVAFLITKWNSVSAAFEGQAALDLPDPPSPDEFPTSEKELPARKKKSPSGDTPADAEVPAALDPPTEAISSELPAEPVAEDAPDLTVEDETPSPPPSPLPETLPVPAPTDPPGEDLEEHERVLESLHLELVTGTKPLAASSLASYIGLKSGIDEDVVERVISSFWSYYLTPIRFIQGQLVVKVPLVGSFTLYRKTGGSPGVTLKQVDPGILAAAQKTIHAIRDQGFSQDHHGTPTGPEGEDHDISRVAASLAEEHDLELKASYTIVLELLALVTTLISIGTRRIRWPGIGEMYPARGAQGATTYRFRIYKNLVRALASVPVENFVDLVNAPAEEEGPHIRPGHRKKDSTSNTPGCLLVFAAILFFVFVMNDGCRAIRRALGSMSPVLQQQDPDNRWHDSTRPLARRSQLHSGASTGFKGITSHPLPGTNREPRWTRPIAGLAAPGIVH